LNLTEVQQVLDITHVYPVIKKLIDKKVCMVWESMSDRYKTKTEEFVLLNPQFENEKALEELMNKWSKAPKQMELLLSYLHLSKTEGEVAKTSLLKKSGATPAQLNGLAAKNIIRLEKRSVDRMRGDA
jgi:primosomal protein N' (replication factor Y)